MSAAGFEPDLFQGATSTRVVNVKTDSCDIYCGRAVLNRFPASVWQNRHTLESEKDRPAVVAAFEVDLDQNPTLLCRLIELRGKRLGCWCAPKLCHCNVLARRADAPTKEMLLHYFRVRFRGHEHFANAPVIWLELLDRWKVLPAAVASWREVTEEAAEHALRTLAKVHAGFPRLDKPSLGS